MKRRIEIGLICSVKIQCGNVGAFYTIPYREKICVNIGGAHIFFSLYIRCILLPHLPHSHIFKTPDFLNFVSYAIQGYTQEMRTFSSSKMWEICGSVPTKVGAYRHRRDRSRSQGAARRTVAWFCRCAWSWCTPCRSEFRSDGWISGNSA